MVNGLIKGDDVDVGVAVPDAPPLCVVVWVQVPDGERVVVPEGVLVPEGDPPARLPVAVSVIVADAVRLRVSVADTDAAALLRVPVADVEAPARLRVAVLVIVTDDV